MRVQTPVGTNRHNGKGAQRNNYRDNWRNQIDDLLRLRGHNLLFKGHLEGVCYWLENTEGTSAVGSDTALDLGHDTSLDQCHVGERRQQGKDHNGTFDNCSDDGIMQKLKHAPPPVLVCALLACPNLPMSEQYRKDCRRQFRQRCHAGWHMSIAGPAGELRQLVSPSQLSHQVVDATLCERPARDGQRWSWCHLFRRK